MEEQSLQAILAKATTVSDENRNPGATDAGNCTGRKPAGTDKLHAETRLPCLTITVNLNTPQVSTGQAPSGTLSVAVGNVDNTIFCIQ